MAEAERAEQGTVDRLARALRDFDEQLEELRGNVQERLKQAQARIDREREKLDERWRDTPLYQRARETRDKLDNQRKQFEAQWKDTTLYKQAEKARKNWEERFEKQRGQILDRIGLVTKSEIARTRRQLNEARREISQTKGLLSSIDQKLDTLARKVNKLVRENEISH